MGARDQGILELQVDGKTYYAKGNFSYNLGVDKREMIMGADGPHNFKVTPQVPFIEGEVTDTSDLDLGAFQALTDITVNLKKRNGKVIVLRNASYCHEGTVGTEEGNIPVRFEGFSADEVPA